MNNNHRYQQNNRYNNGNGQRYNQQNRAQFSRKDQLERDLRQLERDLVALDCQIDVLGEKGRLLEYAKNAHMQSMPLAIAQVTLSTLGLRFLPPVARTWYYKHQEYLRTEESLKYHALSLHTKRQVICSQMYQIEIQLEMLQYQP